MSEINKEINKLFYATAEMIYETDLQHGDGRNYWPFHPVLLDSLVAPSIFEELYRLLKLLEGKGCSIKRIAKIIKSPTRIASYQYLWPSKTLKTVSLRKKKYLAETFVKLLKILRNEETYCENFHNSVWSSQQVEKYIKENKRYFISKKKNPEMARLLSKLEGLLMSYAELLYYYMLDFSRMAHSPYDYKNKVAFAKEFLDLKAEEMWDLARGFPFDHFQEVGIYPSNIKIQVFFMGHTHTNISFPEALESFILKLDEKPITSLKELQNYYQKTEKVVDGVVKFMSKHMNDEKFLLKRGLDLFFYPLKDLYKEVGEDWRKILPKVYEFAKKEKSKIRIPNPWGDWPKERCIKFLLKQMDFRKH